MKLVSPHIIIVLLRLEMQLSFILHMHEAGSGASSVESDACYVEIVYSSNNGTSPTLVEEVSAWFLKTLTT